MTHSCCKLIRNERKDVWEARKQDEFSWQQPGSRHAKRIRPIQAQQCPFGEDTCQAGFVWRDAFPGDHVCVPGAIRDQAASDNARDVLRKLPPTDICIHGFVWREAGPSDHVCVDGQTRDQTRLDNQAAASRREASCRAPVDGSFRGGCRNIAFSNNVLSAECREWSGRYLPRTELPNPQACLDDIGDFGGYLGCNKRPIPQGSYRRYCDEWVWTMDSSLHALCNIDASNNNNPDRRKYVLQNDQSCIGDVFFDEERGELFCSRAPIPGGPYQSTCRYARVENGTLFAACQYHDNRPWPFGSTRYRYTEIANVSNCADEIRNNQGNLTCAQGFPAPDVTNKSAEQADRIIRDLGLVQGQAGPTCIPFAFNIVKAQDPAPGSIVRSGDRIAFTNCLSSATAQCPSPRQVNFCVTCPGGFKSELPGLTCATDAQIQDFLETRAFVNCRAAPVPPGQCLP